MRLLEILRGRQRDLRIKHDVEIRLPEFRQVGGRGAQRRGYADVNSERSQQPRDFLHVVAAAEAERGRAEQIHERFCTRRPFATWPRQCAHESVESFGCAPILLLLIGRQFERNDGDRQIERAGQAAGVVLDQLGGAGGANDHRLRAEALVCFAHGRLEEFRGIGAEIARLEGRVGDRRPIGSALDHREQADRHRCRLAGRAAHSAVHASKRRHAWRRYEAALHRSTA